MRRMFEEMLKIQKNTTAEQSGLIISRVAFKPCPSEQSDRRLPGEARAANRGERRKPEMRGDKTVGHKEGKW